MRSRILPQPSERYLVRFSEQEAAHIHPYQMTTAFLSDPIAAGQIAAVAAESIPDAGGRS
jgi:hypothetical protein